MKEAIKILGASIGKPSLKYKKLPQAIFRKGLIDNGGLTPDAAGLLIEINNAISSGEVKAETRTELNTTSTTLEDFAASTFAPAYLATPKPKLKEKFGGAFLRMILFFIT